jgi:CheY-like chemotaxis protein
VRTPPTKSTSPIARRPSTPEPQPQHSPSAPKTLKPRILVVDDNADAANSLGRLLSLLGQDVAVAHNGEAAVAAAAQFRPQVVLLDIGMPGIDGIETARRIHALPGAESTVLVALTGWGHDRDRQRTEAAGFTAHLVKPVQMEQLEALLARFSGPA